MAEALREAFSRIEGLGLAANQIGLLYRAAIVVLEPEGEMNPPNPRPIVLLNPRILWRSEELVVEEEGCLSLPGIFAEVPRAKAVRVEYQDKDGHRHIIEAHDLNARLLQHELDHLDGILFLDLLRPAERQRVLRIFRERGLRKEAVPSAVQVRR